MGMRQYSHSVTAVTGNSMTSDAQVSPAGQLVRTRGHDNRQYSDRLPGTRCRLIAPYAKAVGGRGSRTVAGTGTLCPKKEVKMILKEPHARAA